MTPRRAFWEALVTIGVPSLLVWGVVLYLLRAQVSAEDWPLFAILVALPLPLFFPIYHRYRKGIHPGQQNRKPWFHLACAILIASLAVDYVFDALHRSSWDRLFHLALAAGWLFVSIDHFRRWAKARSRLHPG
jgi:hypothetical protein